MWKAASVFPLPCVTSATSATILKALSQALIPTPSGEQIPISEVARVFYSRGPAMIRDEDGALTGYVYLNLNTTITAVS
jgi:Cu/Ag efflux pump CusA